MYNCSAPYLKKLNVGAFPKSGAEMVLIPFASVAVMALGSRVASLLLDALNIVPERFI